jgi:filamentous hemagglutinin
MIIPRAATRLGDLRKTLEAKKKGVIGTHNLDAFNQAVVDKNLRIVSQVEHPNVKGLYDIEYQLPKLDKQLNPTGVFKDAPSSKTAYDPKIISNDKILQLGQEAAAKGYNSAISVGDTQYTAEAGGIKFRVYLDPKNPTIVNNFHPEF